MSPCVTVTYSELKSATYNYRQKTGFTSYLHVFPMPWLWQRFSSVQRVTYYSSYTLARSIFTAPVSPVVLRPYQESCLDACTAALDSGATRIGVSLPTGSGKTTVFISLLSRILPPAKNPKATRSLIVVNSIELARQSAAQAEALFPDWVVEIEQGVKHKASGLADVYALAL